MPSSATAEDLVADIRAVAQHLGKGVDQLTRDEWMSSPVRNAPKRSIAATFGTWAVARDAASGVPLQEPFEVEQPPSDIADAEELVERQKENFRRLRDHHEARKLIPVKVNLDGPIGILHFGDPHVDDSGCDIEAIERHTDLVRNTEGLFGANIGDTTNNWIGRLGSKYGDQTATAQEAWVLAEWFVRRCQWLYLIAGNHDCWSGSGDPLVWIARQAQSLYQKAEARLGLKFPSGREVRVHARHNFPGSSIYNTAHGAMREAQFGLRDHVLVNGHTHVSGYGVVKDPQSGIVSHCVQVASYKIYDGYAKEKGFKDCHISPCAVTVIDPDAPESATVQVFWCPETAADYLTFLRQKRKAA